ncbi:MAG: hypothetical protein H3C47_04920 [Candidatus Cloacimonetes bacterium]|nr:hypothetical protein [Candidatus Cloacimonadota bacterium]
MKKRSGFSTVEIVIGLGILVTLFGVLIFAFARRNAHSVGGVEQSLAFGHVRRLARACEAQIRQASRVIQPKPGEESSTLILNSPAGEVTIGLDPEYNLYKSSPSGMLSSATVSTLLRNPSQSYVMEPFHFRVRTERTVELYVKVKDAKSKQDLVGFFDTFRF